MDEIIERIDERLRIVGLSDRAASMQASGKPDLIRDVRRKKTLPKGDTLAALAEALETTVEYLRFGQSTGTVIADRRTGYEAEPTPPVLGRELRRTLPVHGTALGAYVQFGDGEVESHIIETETIDWIRRPQSLEGRKDVYALYINGSSMEPRFEPGDPVIVDPKRAPKPGDDVIVQITDDRGTVVEVALIKRLVKRTAEYIELRQYNPPATFRVPIVYVRHLHRVMVLNDLIG